jgi:hypothetical protein
MLVDLQSAPSRSMRRWFGFSLGVLLGCLAFLGGQVGEPLNTLLLLSAVVIATAYYLWPASQLPIIRGWQYLTFPVAWIVGHALFGLIFFGVVMPIGLLLRAFHYDPLRIRQTRRTSNWQDRPPSPSRDRYFKQF